MSQSIQGMALMRNPGPILHGYLLEQNWLLLENQCYSNIK